MPVLVGGAEGEAVGGEVGVHAVEAAVEDLVLVALLHHQRHEDAVVGRAAEAVRALGSEELRPGLGRRQVGVVDVKEGQHLARARPETVEGAVCPVPEGGGTSTRTVKTMEENVVWRSFLCTSNKGGRLGTEI